MYKYQLIIAIRSITFVHIAVNQKRKAIKTLPYIDLLYIHG